MDDRTTQLLQALDPISVELLVDLLAGPATEAELAASLDADSQPTANRRLKRLSDARLVTREGGKPHAPGRLWTVVHPDETGALLEALVSLVEAIETRDKARRDVVKRKLKLARAERLGIRSAGQD